MSRCLPEQFMASFIGSEFCGVEFGMGRSSRSPSIGPAAGDDRKVIPLGGLRPVRRKAKVEHTDFGIRGSVSGLQASASAALGLIMGFQRNKPTANGANARFPGFIEPELNSSDLVERAEIAAKQMRYFGLAARKSSFSELTPSAKRAGFALLKEDTVRKEARFQWATGKPDFTFSVSFENPDRVSVIAESCAGDIFGLVLVSHSHVPNISVETKPWLGNDELGSNALRFRNTLLRFPDFDGMPAWTKY
jgi:hypothetical protein